MRCPATTLHARDAWEKRISSDSSGWLFSNGTTGPWQRSNQKPQKRLCALRQSPRGCRVRAVLFSDAEA